MQYSRVYLGTTEKLVLGLSLLEVEENRKDHSLMRSMYQLDIVELSQIIFFGVSNSEFCHAYQPFSDVQHYYLLKHWPLPARALPMISYFLMYKINLLLLCAYAAQVWLEFCYPGWSSRESFKTVFISTVFSVLIGIQYYYLMLVCVKTIPNK